MSDAIAPRAPRAPELPVCEIAITQAMIDAYAELSGDFNPVHVDAGAGEAAGFGGTIAHGCIPMEPIVQALCRWLETDALPPGTVVRLRYRKPSRPGDTIRSQARLSGEPPTGSGVGCAIAFACVNQHGETVIDGDCEVPAEAPA